MLNVIFAYDDLVDVPYTVETTEKQRANETVYDDVLWHTPKKDMVLFDSRSTTAHENIHMISSHLRQLYSKRGKINGFYLLDNKALILKQPKITISQAASYVPKNLRGSRFDVYFKRQSKYWDSEPLYIIEEHLGYVTGGMCAVNDYVNGKSTEDNTDVCSAAMEFIAYSTAVAMCVKDKDPDYWDREDDFIALLYYLNNTSSGLFTQSREIPQLYFESAEKHFDKLINSEEGKTIISFIQQELEPRKKYSLVPSE